MAPMNRYERDDVGRARSAPSTHLKALLCGIGLFLVTGLGLGLLGLLVGAAGDGAVPGTGGAPIELGSVAFFTLTAIVLSPIVALCVGVAIGAADGRNPIMRGLMAGIASFIGFFALVIATLVVSGAEIGNTLQNIFSGAGNINFSDAGNLGALALSAVPATGVGLLSGLLTAVLWPHKTPYARGVTDRDIDRDVDRDVDRRYVGAGAVGSERFGDAEGGSYRERPRYGSEGGYGRYGREPMTGGGYAPSGVSADEGTMDRDPVTGEYIGDRDRDRGHVRDRFRGRY